MEIQQLLYVLLIAPFIGLLWLLFIFVVINAIKDFFRKK